MRSIPSPLGILLDVGNTILREEHYDLLAGLKCLDPQVDPCKLTAELQAQIELVQGKANNEFNLRQWLETKRSLFSVAGSPADLERIVWDGGVFLSPMSGVAEGLARLAHSDLTLGCISNAVFSDDVLQSELAKHGVSQYLRFVVSSASVGYRKPDRKIFRQGLTKMGLDPTSVWFVGDSFSADIRGAARAGCFPVWFSGMVAPDSDIRHAQVTNWIELCELVDSRLS